MKETDMFRSLANTYKWDEKINKKKKNEKRKLLNYCKMKKIKKKKNIFHLVMPPLTDYVKHFRIKTSKISVL